MGGHFRVGLMIALSVLPLTAQDHQTSAEMLREAGRLATEGSRICSEATYRLRHGEGRGYLEDQRRAAALFAQALELWRDVAHVRRYLPGIEELTRIYLLIDDMGSIRAVLAREDEHWGARGDKAMQAQVALILATRESQLDLYDAAIVSADRALRLSREAAAPGLERNALMQLAGDYKQIGMEAQGEALSAEASELSDRIDRDSPTEPEPTPASDRIPVQWVDLPTAPLVAAYRDVNGTKQAVLVNRTKKGVQFVAFSCVAADDGRVKALEPLSAIAINDGSVLGDSYFEPFGTLSGPMNQWTDERFQCAPSARMALTRARFTDGMEWKAEGIDWEVP